MAASGEKPYRVYKGGRAKGRVPLARRDDDVYGSRGKDGRPVVRRPRRRWTWRRWLLVLVIGFILFLVVWAVVGYLSVRSGVADANGRLPAGVGTVLTKQDGLLLSHPSNILLLGTDHSTNGQQGRSADEHSDSILLLRTDPGRHRLTYLSIPRDLRASVPGIGETKVNAAMQAGGPKLAIRTVAGLTGLQINHVVVVDFGAFVKLIDALGGIDVDVPERILSNRFDCPYKTVAQCQRWPGWRFAKGVQHMDGHRALIYSRVRENRLNPADTDLSRGQHQQQVMQATLSKLASVGTFFGLPFHGSSLLAPLSTDLSTIDFLQLAWVKFRAGTTVHCRLGGRDYGNGYITGDQENIAVIQMVVGNSAPQPPPPGSGLFGPGCVSGNESFG